MILAFGALLGVSLLLNLEQTLWCLLVVPTIHEVTPNGEKQADADVSSAFTCICPEANVQAWGWRHVALAE